MRFAKPGSKWTSSLLGLLVGLAAGGVLSATLLSQAALATEPPDGLLGAHESDQLLDWDSVVQRLSRADVVFLGEQHDDPATHRLERALLEALHAATRKRLVLSLEMFERDVQPVLDAYLEGRIPESEFLAKARPWPTYAKDYRPLVEYAKANGIHVIAANVPRPMASRVAKEGLESLNQLPPEERAWAAAEVPLPEGRLRERFREALKTHPGVDDALIEKMFQAQCLKDATMAESIAARFGPDAPPTLVLHVNGAFHSDERLGVPAQLERLRPDLQQRVTTVQPVTDPVPPVPAGLADVVFRVRREKP